MVKMNVLNLAFGCTASSRVAAAVVVVPCRAAYDDDDDMHGFSTSRQRDLLGNVVDVKYG